MKQLQKQEVSQSNNYNNNTNASDEGNKKAKQSTPKKEKKAAKPKTTGTKKNANTMSKEFVKRDYNIISGGTENHLMLIDLRNKNITGKEAEENLGKADITINKNMVPFDTESPFVTSGMRVGTAAITTRGMEEDDMKKIVDFIDRVICDTGEIEAVRKEINEWANNFPLHK